MADQNPSEGKARKGPEPLSILADYGDREVFERKQKEGYDEIAFGRGEWVDQGNYDSRIIALWAFYDTNNPDRNIATQQFIKIRENLVTRRGGSFEEEYSQQELDKYIADMKITLEGRGRLEEVIALFDEVNNK